MLDILGQGFKQAKEAFTGHSKLSAENIDQALSKVRSSLLEADVEYGVVKDFIQKVKDEALGLAVKLKAGKGSQKVRVSPGDHFIKICQKQLEVLMGPVDTSFHFASNRPSVLMMVGLQGSGKTTTTGKLCKFLLETRQRKPLLVGADIYRPAAVDQLKVLGQRLNVPVYADLQKSPQQLCKDAIKHAFDIGCDTILFDTAGRLSIDETLMKELREIKALTQPDDIFFVCDAMMGQDAVTTAKAFDEQLDLSGFIMTKLDGDARGGAALSIKHITGKPIKFLGMGEGLEQLEEFRPEGLASRILGMGDVVGLMQDFERVAEEDAEEDAMRMLQGQFTFKDFYKQIAMIQKMGSLKDIVDKLPMQNLIPKGANLDDRELLKVKSMIDSMTEQERMKPQILNASRAKRIALGSGRSEKEVGELITKFRQMQKMMGNLGKSMGSGLLGKIPGMGALNQMRSLRQMSQGMGMPGGMEAMMGGGDVSPRKNIDRDKQRKMRKAAKQARKKNRKR